ncbi:MAG: isoprenyl transferase [Planctomycetaceae bacterium]|nr:isoprenyl transferase [Planctomycetaceae bacterium]MBQ2820861.1 isoprenyl transferase [Thermoguttaceae bacterium]MDO4425701.1 isoprenyl transferase [Planctomycetia bacterium]
MFFNRKKKDNSAFGAESSKESVRRIPAKNEKNVPEKNRLTHVAIIMDGNGRWAQKRGLPRAAGHRQGAKVVEKIVAEAVRMELENLTLYCFSHENWKRPRLELDAIMRLLEQFMVSSRPTIMENNVRLRVVGRRNGIPDSALKKMDETIAMSEKNSGLCLTLAINYGGRQELVDAARNLALKVKSGELDPDEINEKRLESELYSAGMPDPDLLIRTAGEMRLSNFLLWQLSYAELWVTDVCWPDFSEELFQQALESFQNRTRRFGAIT